MKSFHFLKIQLVCQNSHLLLQISFNVFSFDNYEFMIYSYRVETVATNQPSTF